MQKPLLTFIVLDFATSDTSPKRSVRFFIASVNSGVAVADCPLALFFFDGDWKEQTLNSEIIVGIFLQPMV